MKDFADITLSQWSEITSIFAALGIGLGAWQLRITKNQARTAFEDSLSREYRALLGDLTAQAFFNDLDHATAREISRKRLDRLRSIL